MAIAMTSCNIRDQSPTHAEQMLHLNDGYFNDSRISSRCFAEFDHNPESSPGPPVSVEDFQQQFAGTGNASDLERRSYPESTALSSGTSAVAGEIPHIMQREVVSHPVSHQLCTDHALNGSGLSDDFGFLGFNEFADFWEDMRLYSQEMATAAVFPPQTNGWIEASTSCTRSGDVMSTTVSIELERPLGQSSYALPACANTSAREGNDPECPWPLLRGQSSHSPQPASKGATLRGLNGHLIYHGPSRTSNSDGNLPLRSSSQPETPKKTMFPFLQPCISQKSRFHSQTLAGDRIQDSAVVENVGDTVDVSKLSRTRQYNFVQQELCKSMLKPPHLNGGRQPGECGIDGYHDYTGENLNHLKLKQKPFAKPAPRKYRRRRIPPGINIEHDQVGCVPTRLDHVQRERQRRDVMNSKIAALELLLPKSSKRDRVSVVYDAIQLVKRLERDVKNYQQRFNEAKLRTAGHKKSRDPGRLSMPNSIDCNMETSGSYYSNTSVFNGMGTYMKPVAICTHPARGTNGKSKRTHLSSGTLYLGGSSDANEGKLFIEFHVHLDNTVTVQEEKISKCCCRMDYLSTVIAVVDEFQLDLTDCNIMKLSGYFICIMRLKARTRADMTSAAQFAVHLKSVVDVDIASEATSSILGAKISESMLSKVELHPNGIVC